VPSSARTARSTGCVFRASTEARWLVGLLLAGGLTAEALAEVGRCQAELVGRSAKVVQEAARAFGDCAERVLAGDLPAGTDCRADPAVNAAIAAAALGAQLGVAARCCGVDLVCGTTDDDPLAELGFAAGSCADLAHHGCRGAIADAADAGQCLTCAARAAVELVAESLFARFVPGAPGSDAARCQRALVTATERLLVKRSRLLAACWGRRAKGLAADDCAASSGATAAALARAEAAAAARACRSCGGADHACGGTDDLAPAALGALAACPTVVTLDGTACGGPIATAADLVACATCVARFAGDCADRLAVPALAAYPDTCNPPFSTLAAGLECETSLGCPPGYACESNGAPTTRYCVGGGCDADTECSDGGICRPRCTTAGCAAARCQTPGFGCAGADVLCFDDGGLACRKICTQDSDCIDPFGLVCVNPGFGFGVCIGTTPCQ
jgi:hypothetical protein